MKHYTLVLLACILLCACTQKKENSAEVRASVPAQSEQVQQDYTSEFGVQAYSFRNYFPKDMLGTLDKIQEMGITKIEGDGGRIPPEEFRRLCAERAITIPSTGAGFQELKDDPMAIVDKAKKLGANYVMCAWIPHEERGNFTKEDADNGIAVFNSAGKILAENGITLAYHPHGYEFQPYEDGTLLDYIISNSNEEHVAFEMDIMWIHFGGGDPVALLNKYPTRWKMMHLKDLKKGTPKDLTGGTDVENNVVLGTGELNMPEILSTGKKVGVEHFFIEDESSVVMTQVPESIAYLKSLKTQ